MCSIFGFNFDDKTLIKKMSNITKHRGPDDRGFFIDDALSIGQNRLKIIDLSKKAKQPMSNEDKTIWIVFNGEIYNFRELKQKLKKHDFKSNSDTETILHGYEEWGIDVLNKLQGMFAFAIYDKNKNILFLARDRIGIKPLYYYFDGKNFIFASEQKAILLYTPPKIDKIAIDQLFTFQYPLTPRTLFSNIKKLPPGKYMIFNLKTKTFEIKKYWDLDPFPKNHSFEYYTTTLEKHLKQAIKSHLISDVPLGIYLSGGLDSSYIAGIAKEINEDIKAYTIDFGINEEEINVSKQISSYLDIDHKIIKVEAQNYKLLPKVTWHLDEPAVNIASLPLYIMSKVSKKYLTVALMGDGGDEIFGGYDKYKYLEIREKIKPLLKLKPLINLLPINPEIKKRLQDFLSQDDYKAYLSYVSTFSPQEKHNLSIEPKDSYLKEYFSLKIPTLQKAFYIDIKTLLPDNYLMKVDKSTMAAGIEARVPYLDHKIVELSLKIPPHYKVKNLKTKIIFRKIITKKFPKNLITKKKHPFMVPTQQWLNEGLKEIAIQFIDSSNILNKEYAKKILENFERNKRYYTRQFWLIFTFILWHKMYFENPIERAKFDIDYYL